MYNAAVYKGSFTWSWNDLSASSVATFGSNTLFRFNAVKLEALSCVDLTTGFPSNPLPGPLFLVIDELSPLSFEFVHGQPLRIIGGAQWGGGGFLITDNNLSQIKMTSDCLDFLRGTLTFRIYGGDGLPITTTAVSYKAATVSFWEVTKNKSSTS